jgi:hypothetical protein
MPPIDYNKWAAASFGSDDDDDDEPRKPRVTRLEGPSTITLGAPETVAPAAPQIVSAVPRQQPPQAKPKARAGVGFDYSKWDALQVSDDDDDNDDEHRSSDGDGRDDDPLDAEELRRARELLSSQQQQSDGGGSSQSATLSPATDPQAAAAATAVASFEALRAKLTRNGAERAGHLWRQTEAEVEVCVLLPRATRARDVRPELVAADPLSSQQQTLVVHRSRALAGASASATAAAEPPPVFLAALAYPVLQPASAEELAWEVTDYEPASAGGRRVLRVTLQKEMPQGIIVWWERAIDGEPATDTTVFPDRKRAAAVQKQQDVWNEAQRMFREKVAQRKKIVVDAGDGCMDE